MIPKHNLWTHIWFFKHNLGDIKKYWVWIAWLLLAQTPKASRPVSLDYHLLCAQWLQAPLGKLAWTMSIINNNHHHHNQYIHRDTHINTHQHTLWGEKHILKIRGAGEGSVSKASAHMHVPSKWLMKVRSLTLLLVHLFLITSLRRARSKPCATPRVATMQNKAKQRKIKHKQQQQKKVVSKDSWLGVFLAQNDLNSILSPPIVPYILPDTSIKLKNRV